MPELCVIVTCNDYYFTEVLLPPLTRSPARRATSPIPLGGDSLATGGPLRGKSLATEGASLTKKGPKLISDHSILKLRLRKRKGTFCQPAQHRFSTVINSNVVVLRKLLL